MNGKRKYVIGNWKSNKNTVETENWFETFKKQFSQGKNILWENLEVVICPPFILLPKAAEMRDDYHLPIKIGVQDISPFENGAYTGEVSGSMIAEFASYAIIGHSERRNNFGEDDKLLSEKVKQANEAKLVSVYCIQNETTSVPAGVDIVAYEPVWAIGTGKTDTPENADKVARIVKQKCNGKTLIYGGSVMPDNIKSFITTENIDGVLIGGASLDPSKFWEMIVNAATL